MLFHAENVFLLESFYKTGSVKLTQNEFRRRFGKEVDRRTVYRQSEKLRDHGTITDRRVIIRIRDAPVVTDQFVNRVSRELKGLTSLRKTARSLQTSVTSVRKAAKKQKFFHYKLLILKELKPDITWFQQDGATPHTANESIDLVKSVFGNRTVGRRLAVNWPPRSPDLTPLDFFLWGNLKERVFKDVKATTIRGLKDRIKRYQVF